MTATRPAALARVAARLREELANLERVQQAMAEALASWGPQTPQRPIIHWVGGLVHDFYTGLEKAFREVSPELNGLDRDRESWHRDLLHAMTLDLPGHRPAVIRRVLEPGLLELLKFRHLYRNLYSFDLRWDRVRGLCELAAALWPETRADLDAFAAGVEAMAGV
ncbi:MAG: antitoxin [Deltaproteobacteria bacterium]|nr:antitoxin [Deltaproteobacteria bacterium]